MRSVRPQASRQREAIAWAKEVASYLTREYRLGLVEVYSERFGATGTIYWIMDFRDMSALEDFSSGLPQDADYNALVARGNQLIVDGSNRDLVLRLL